MNEEKPPDSQWHLDKRVPIVLVTTMLFQFAMGVWWASAISSRVGTIESALTVMSDQNGRIIRLETQYANLQSTINSIDAKLDRLLQVRYEQGPPSPP